MRPRYSRKLDLPRSRGRLSFRCRERKSFVLRLNVLLSRSSLNKLDSKRRLDMRLKSSVAWRSLKRRSSRFKANVNKNLKSQTWFSYSKQQLRLRITCSCNSKSLHLTTSAVKLVQLRRSLGPNLRIAAPSPLASTVSKNNFQPRSLTWSLIAKCNLSCTWLRPTP